MRAIKRMTYHNFMRVMKMIEAKGYDPGEAEHMTRRVFELYTTHPNGPSVLSLVDRLIPKDEWDRMYKGGLTS